MSTAATRFSNIAIGACALVLAALAVRREIRSEGPETKPVESARYVSEWRELRSNDVRIGPADAPVQLIEFVDFECPYCAGFASRLTRIMRKHPESISVTLKHLPVLGHRFARPAATAFECAKQQGKMREMHDALFAAQDSLGLKPLREFAAAAGVYDLAEFDRCAKVEAAPIAEDVALATELGVFATPTIIMNGWLLASPPSDALLEEAIRLAKDNRAWSPPRGDTIPRTMIRKEVP